MFILGVIGFIVVFFVVLVFAGITCIAVGLEYAIPAILILLFGIGIFTWIKISYRKIKTYIFKKVHYPDGTYKV